MACYNKMERTFLQGLLWMYLLGFGFMALSLEPGFLDFDNLPDTNFTCVGKVIGGYYADLETNCQMFHVCTIGQLDEPMDIRFLCLNGTVFDQETRVCERIDEVDCTKSEQFYSLNLELYGNSQLSNLEENPETEQPLIIKSTPPSTTTPTLAPPRSSSRPAYFTTATPTNDPRQHQQQQQRLPSHHFPIVDSNTSPDIRFNPEEINISLNPGSPPNIRTNHPHPVSYYSDKKVIGAGAGQVRGASTGKSERGGYDGTSEAGDSYGDGEFGGYGRVTPRDVNFGFKFGELRELKEEEEEEEEDESEDSYRFQTQFKPSRQYEAPPQNSSPRQYTSSTYRNNEFTSPTTAKNYHHHHQSPSTATTTTVRSYYPSPLTPPAVERKSQYEDHSERKNQYADHGERKSQYEDRGVPQRISLPLPTLTFSTPAPFSLQRRVEQKRYTKDHLPPPRIVISASASVSDASGRKLNYSLGTIDTSPLLKQPPATYDEYKDEDVVLDPFYIDVQKLKSAKRRKRHAEEEKLSHYDIIKNDEDAVRVLKFLFDWYRNEKTNPSRFTTPLTSQSITAINDELSPREATSDLLENDRLDFKSKSSDVFSKNSKYSLVGHEEVRKINDVQKRLTFQGTDDDEKDELFNHEEDYINDNYEPAAYDHKYGNHGFEYNDGKDSEEKSIHEFVRLNEKAKNFSVPGDYVDDNIEPIYYRDQIDEYSKISEDFPVADHSENDTNELEQPGNVDMFTSTSPETTIPTTEIVETTEKSTTTTTSRSRSNRRRGRRKYQAESKDKEENKNAHIGKLIEKPYRAKDDYDYLRTVHIHTSSPKIATSETRTTLEESETKSTETPVAHTETPVASKETPVAHTETPVTSKEPLVALTESPAAFNEILVADTESPAPVEETLIAHRESPVFFEEIPVSDEAPSVSSTENTNPKLPDEVFDDVVMITTTTTTTESSRSRSSKRRRGKHKYQEETYQKKSQRRRKPPKPPEAEVATGQKISSLEYIGSSPGLSLEVSTSQSPAEKNLSFEVTPMENYSDLSVALETSPKSKPAKNRRGRMKFLNPIEDLTEHFREPSTESPARSTVLPAATWSQEEVLGTPNLSSTESSYQLNDSVPNESFPQATSTTLHENSTYAYSKLLEEVYATAFVPTIESVHITKKKQLKDNLLNSEFPTTESNLEVNTRRNTDTTEYYTQSTGDFWTTDLHTVIEAVESSTKSSFVPDLFTQITEGKDEVESTVEPMTSETTTLYKNHIFSKGMNLVSIVVEEESATDATLAQSDFEMSTETFPVTQTSTQLEHKDITSTETPVVHTHTPFASTETPTTIPPPTPLVTSTSTDIDSTDTFPKTTNSFRNPSVSSTDISLAYRDTPVAHTETPVAFTGPPVASRIPPLGHSETPVVFENATVASKKTVTPIVLKETPVAPNGRHIASTETYLVREEKLVDSKEIPVPSEETPAAFKKSHVTSTEHIHRGTPVVFEVTPVASKETTVTFEEAYVTFTELPVASDTPVTHPKKPLAFKGTPIVSKGTPVVSKGTPVVSKETHTIFTESVVTPEDPPVAFEETLVTSTETPVAHTEIPVHVETTTSADYTQIPTTFEQTTLSSVEETTTDQSTTTKRPQRRRGGNPTRRKPTGYSRYKHRFVAEKETRKGKEFSTDFPLRKSVNPTQAERTLVTTPLSRMTVTVRKHFFFNCFGKEVDKFYADSRDCRLFHYCTQGYNENQLLDMKFVCDFNTFFDDEKLICTKTKPKRCL